MGSNMTGSDTCTSIEGFTLGPGGFNCSQLVEGNYCTSTGGEGTAWQAAWGNISRYTVDSYTAVMACCGCGKFSCVRRLLCVTWLKTCFFTFDYPEAPEISVLVVGLWHWHLGRETYLALLANSTTAPCVWTVLNTSGDQAGLTYEYTCPLELEVPSGLSNVAVAGIVLGIISVLVLVAGVVSYVLLNQRAQKRVGSGKVSAENAAQPGNSPR